MGPKSDKAFPLLTVIYNVFAIPYNFVLGFVLGMAAPVAVIAAMVAGVRLLTGGMPFLSLDREGDQGKRHLSIELVPPDEAEARFQVQKEQITSELGILKAEIQSIIEEARAESEQVAEATTEA